MALQAAAQPKVVFVAYRRLADARNWCWVMPRAAGRHNSPAAWMAAQLATALHGHSITLSTRQTRKYLQQMGARWRRTARTLRHKHDPDRVA